MANTQYKGLGRRKSSVARVLLTPGTGKFLVNKVDPNTFFPNKLVIQDMMQPLTLLKVADKFDVEVSVFGGGFNGQAGAIRLGLARALIEVKADYKSDLRQAGLVTRDARVKERKKFGLYGARRAPQFTKR
ncbi:30S ribosomal protein S9 [Ureaplasma sp. ES3154-GEN]|uniref:30S ribosomal protein S9 n=1 Tax=Ureaplasma sp. ES3154-GEN TaxID=2984844 RepID=UPI0021E75EA5|nr:30S ribosomal protein S9 [Ureaplasma sp. ES3154-GEN]MCV3743421.1 30S ribosomal protein S9 [Ureaplasma sp. ES3154-GEN]